jgi:23S rRNA (cytosine1962-C5)-methyltransferase
MTNESLTQLINTAFQARSNLIENLKSEGTDTYRLFHGINEGWPGLTIDIYGPQVYIQTFRQSLEEEQVLEIKSAVSALPGFTGSFVYNDRSGKKLINYPIDGEPDSREPMICREMGVQYRVVGFHRGQDPLLFIDLRAARRYVMERCNGKTLLNLFAYTCGLGVGALASGADQVWNIDFSQTFLDYGKESTSLNSLSRNKIQFVQQDVFPVIRQFSGLGVKGKGRRRKFLHYKPKTFDFVFLDPPTFARSPFGAVDIINDYQGLFKPALICVEPGGTIICTNHAPSVQFDDWLEQLERCAIKAERPIKNIHIIEPEKDFPSPDGNSPLKVVALQV